MDTSFFQNKTWYHQRFDGTPLFLFFIGEAELLKEARKPAGTEANIRVCYFAQGTADWYLDTSDIARGRDVIIGLANQEPNISEHLMAAWQKDEEAFAAFFWKEFPSINVGVLSDEDLLDLWQRYHRLAIKRFSSSSIIDHFALGTDTQILAMIREELGSGLWESEYTKIFSVLTAPTHQSFISEAEIDLLRIATGRSKEVIAVYQQRYFWIHNNYTDAFLLDVPYFEKALNDRQMAAVGVKETLARLEATPAINKAQKENMLKKYSFSAALQTLLHMSEDFSWWQDERKKAAFMNIHIGSQLLAEIGKRQGYDVDSLKYALPQEIESIIKAKGVAEADLKERRRRSVLVMKREDSIFSVGQAVEDIHAVMFPKKSTDKIRDIRGLSASLGKVQGKVKVVLSATEISKVMPGDILVAVMTRPDYIPAMRNAAAIVTNEGGVTSHAAIVSRELDIPCVIGTKIATEVFQDGDMVEVDANHGVVRKI